MKSKTIGIIGGGQLGMMLTDAIHSLGGRVVALDPDMASPITINADEFICASYDSFDKLEELASKVDVITYEFENVKSEYLLKLKDTGKIIQGLEPLFDSQDRLREKKNALDNGLKPVRFFDIKTFDDLVNSYKELNGKAIYKTRTLGYDGHGQVVINSISDLENVKPFLNGPGILEEFIDFDYEVSVIMVRDNKKTIALPISYNIHKHGILDLTIVSKDNNSDLYKKIIEDSINFMNKKNYLGILCIEYFVKGNDFYFNEMAPRPHNSGHYSIEGLTHSQYDIFARYLLGEELVEPKIKCNTVMKNILGDDMWMVLKFKDIKNAYIHMYNKEVVRPKRKMGHVTLTDITLEEYLKLEKDM